MRKKYAPKCKYCGLPIRWAITPERKTIALDASPDPNGAYYVEKRRDWTTGDMETVAVPTTIAERQELAARGEFLWVHHPATCPAVEKPGKQASPERIQELIAKANLPEPKRKRRNRLGTRY
ncbi:DUF6083 domain-containing protein [Corynebacterium cystitidis]|uniref:DUF6083 domain-containing protein n=1 Tax=Corynebacterium cystitidis TaxID=35757 RepID=UPI00211EFD34|nr:DUF6083 domain-containing protein [Corynebacterium cystitidis]